ncbi:hypothetical protein Tco_0016699 [Tanacetum coccineum]
MQGKSRYPLALVAKTDNTYPYAQTQVYLKHQTYAPQPQSYTPQSAYAPHPSSLVTYASSSNDNTYAPITQTAQFNGSYELGTDESNTMEGVNKEMAMLERAFKQYNIPTNNNLHTSSNTRLKLIEQPQMNVTPRRQMVTMGNVGNFENADDDEVSKVGKNNDDNDDDVGDDDDDDALSTTTEENVSKPLNPLELEDLVKTATYQSTETPREMQTVEKLEVMLSIQETNVIVASTKLVASMPIPGNLPRSSGNPDIAFIQPSGRPNVLTHGPSTVFTDSEVTHTQKGDTTNPLVSAGTTSSDIPMRTHPLLPPLATVQQPQQPPIIGDFIPSPPEDEYPPTQPPPTTIEDSPTPYHSRITEAPPVQPPLIHYDSESTNMNAIPTIHYINKLIMTTTQFIQKRLPHATTDFVQITSNRTLTHAHHNYNNNHSLPIATDPYKIFHSNI